MVYLVEFHKKINKKTNKKLQQQQQKTNPKQTWNLKYSNLNHMVEVFK